MAAVNQGSNANRGANAPDTSTMNLTNQIQKKIDKLHELPDNPSIYKIPNNLRSVNEKAYTPCRVAIGPYHADNPALKQMEQYKLRCLDGLISRTTNNLKLEDYVKEIKAVEEKARKYYEGINDLEPDRLAEMLLIDGAFIIEFFCIKGRLQRQNSNKHCLGVIFDNPRIVAEIMRDFILLENQLPFFILELLFDLTLKTLENPTTTFSMFAYSRLITMVPIQGCDLLQSTDLPDRIGSEEILHFLHFLTLICSTPSHEMIIPISDDDDEDLQTFTIPFLSATELHDAGVKFKIRKLDPSSLLKIEFSGSGVLKMPHLTLEEFTEMFFRNLMAFEQYYLKTYDITSYMCFMDHLIDTEKDVQILQKRNLIDNWLESKDNVTKVYNSISKHTETIFNADLRRIAKIMKQYTSKHRNTWKAKLRHEYFESPWGVISVLAAILLIILTLIQTFTSVLQVTNNN